MSARDLLEAIRKARGGRTEPEPEPVIQAELVEPPTDLELQFARRIAEGDSFDQALARLGMSPTEGLRVTRRSDFSELVSESAPSFDMVQQRFDGLAPRAQDTLSSLLTSQSDKVKMSAAKAILDYAGHGAIRRTVGVQFNLQKGAEEFMLTVLQEARKLESIGGGGGE